MGKPHEVSAVGQSKNLIVIPHDTEVFRRSIVSDPRVLRRVAQAYRLRSVRLTIIGNNELEIPIGLSQNRLYCGSQKILSIIDWQSNAHAGIVRHVRTHTSANPESIAAALVTDL